MQARGIKKSLCLVFLSMVASVAAAGTLPSVVDRVYRVEDPELGELIRTALRDHWEPSKEETLQVIRKVTTSYAQIKLLDQQILQVSKKLEAATGPAEMGSELLLAKAELESKLMSELTNLREMLGVIPRYPFDKQSVKGLNTWLRLNAINDDRVYVLDTGKPFIDYWAVTDFIPVGLMAQKDALEWIRGRLGDSSNLPIRIDIVWKNQAAEKLRDKVVAVVKEMKAGRQADVRLGKNSFIGSGECPVYLRRGEITTFYPSPVRPPDSSPNTRLVNGRVDPQDLDQHILWRVVYQWNLPLTFRIEHDEASTALASQTADRIRTIAQRLGVTELVGVRSIPVEPVSEAAFLGRWRAVSESKVREIVLQRGGQSELVVDRQPDGSGGPATMSVRWYLTTKEIIIDLDKVYAMGHRYLYRGHLDGEGHLILDTGLIEPQGSFGLSGRRPMTFEKVE